LCTIGGPHIIIPLNILKILVKHPFTDSGIATFVANWKKPVRQLGEPIVGWVKAVLPAATQHLGSKCWVALRLTQPTHEPKAPPHFPKNDISPVLRGCLNSAMALASSAYSFGNQTG